MLGMYNTHTLAQINRRTFQPFKWHIMKKLLVKLKYISRV